GSRVGRALWHRNDRTASRRAPKADARWSPSASLPPTLASRTTFRLAASFSAARDSLGVPRRELLRHGSSRLHANPVQVFMRPVLVSALSAQSQSDRFRSGQWRIAGQNLNNTWSQPAEHSISPANVKGLKPKWVFTTGGDVSATPTVGGDAVYFPDWGGNLFAVKKDSGHLIWSHKI